MTGLVAADQIRKEEEMEEEKRLKRQSFFNAFALKFSKILSDGLKEEINKVIKTKLSRQKTLKEIRDEKK